jgi:hypothetical protein
MKSNNYENRTREELIDALNHCIKSKTELVREFHQLLKDYIRDVKELQRCKDEVDKLCNRY